ncbi:MAG: hypothetical protein QM652_01300 [Legionella sp.]|uniref:hypothetical protein n=1 Tax=Legionella sp. TaxID=459 RepID=UPI0039E3B06F
MGAPHSRGSNVFFKAPASHIVINTGGEQFQAAAVALIDYLKSGVAVDSKVLSKILERFKKYFDHINSERLSVPKDDMRNLIANSRTADLVDCKAHVLRQFAVDELFADPLNLNYREVFKQFDAETPKSTLRNPKVTLDKQALRALEKALGLGITFSFKDQDKELRKQEKSFEFAQSALLIQIQETHYYPAVKNQKDYAYVGKLAIPIKPKIIPAEQEEGTLVEIKKMIKEADEQLAKERLYIRNKLLTVIRLGELPEEKLMRSYITLFSDLSSQELYKITFILGLEYPERLVTTSNRVNPEKLTLGLVDKLSAGVVAGVFTLEQIFDVDNELTPVSALS